MSILTISAGAPAFCTGPWHDRRLQPGIAGEHPLKTDQARARHQRGQALPEFEWRQADDVRGGVAPGALELRHKVCGVIAAEPLAIAGRVIGLDKLEIDSYHWYLSF